MGEDPLRVFNTGATGIDNVFNLQLLTRHELEEELEWEFSSECALFTYHPVTLEKTDIETDLNLIFNILSTFNFNVLFTYANADEGGRQINIHIVRTKT